MVDEDVDGVGSVKVMEVMVSGNGEVVQRAGK